MIKTIRLIGVMLVCVFFLFTVSASGNNKDKTKDKSGINYSQKEKDKKKQEGLDKVAPSIGKGEKAAGILDKISKGVGKIVDKLLPAPGAKDVGDAAGETAKAGAKKVKQWRTRGDAVIGDDGTTKIYNEKTGEWEDF